MHSNLSAFRLFSFDCIIYLPKSIDPRKDTNTQFTILSFVRKRNNKCLTGGRAESASSLVNYCCVPSFILTVLCNWLPLLATTILLSTHHELWAVKGKPVYGQNKFNKINNCLPYTELPLMVMSQFPLYLPLVPIKRHLVISFMKGLWRFRFCLLSNCIQSKYYTTHSVSLVFHYTYCTHFYSTLWTTKTQYVWFIDSFKF